MSADTGVTARESELAMLVSSRICHDLISPLGAIGNGLELLELSGTIAGMEMPLLKDSSRSALARINLFRLAFGPASQGQTMAGDEISRICRSSWTSQRVGIDCDLPATTDRRLARLGVLLVLSAETLCPREGHIALAQTSGGRLAATLTAGALREPPGWEDMLTDAEAPLPAAALVHLPLAQRAAAALGRRIEITRHRGAITLAA
ncbi:histidine phosphotransferase [Palleronia sediminis]|uniref:Histidine phosphotransferase n=1 Tax=Palleronia sediminis TaxID=2547833 RepID=A0A4V3BAL8_9RHOB|nr:histidine phosphotransferase family protein [Palleronia sediminis]TDL83529.1 histidine phosphotransferase [Palleronia sediminis]